MRRPRGFTLVELLVVLAIMAVLLTLVLPQYIGRVEAAREAVLRENLRITRDVISKFYGDSGRYPDSLAELVERRYLAALPIDPITESNTTWQLVPAPEGYRGAVYDIHSGATGHASDGTPFAQW